MKRKKKSPRKKKYVFTKARRAALKRAQKARWGRRSRKSNPNPGGGKPVAKKRRKRRKGTAKRARRAIAKRFVGRAGMKDYLQMGALGVVGAVVGGYIVNRIPIQDNRVKAILPIGLGILVGSSRIAQRTPAIKGASLGLVTVGGLSLARQAFGNTVPLLAGDPTYLGYNNNDLMLGYRPGEEMGDPFDLTPGMGQEETETDYVTPADMM